SLDVIATLPLDVMRGSFGLELNEERGLLCSPGTVWHIDTVQTGARVSYLGSPPSDIVIDGAFADWSSRVPFSDALGDAYSLRTNDSTSGDVDLHTVKIASTEDVASFYMAVNGTMLGGSSVPASMVRWVTPGPPAENITVLKEPLLGADFAMVFIDTDMNQSTGFYIGGSEAAVAVIGKNGRILSSEILTLERGLWNSVGPAEAALDNYQLELSASYEALGLVQGATYSVTFVAQDWSGRQDDIALALPARKTAGTRAFGGIMINEVYDKPAPQNDWVELYNTGTVPVNIAGWQLWVDGTLVATFPSVTILPGEFYVLSKNAFERGRNFVLTDATGAVIDQLSVPNWANGKSYGRLGGPPYTQTGPMSPTPGRLNDGQVAIPEFGDLAIPIAIMPVIVFLFRRFGSRRRA
ncbi:MAG: lamin tail domain-containing protein, partial [Thermoplasmata archaeon]